jgi:hypothetical protein
MLPRPDYVALHFTATDADMTAVANIIGHRLRFVTVQAPSVDQVDDREERTRRQQARSLANPLQAIRVRR